MECLYKEQLKEPDECLPGQVCVWLHNALNEKCIENGRELKYPIGRVVLLATTIEDIEALRALVGDIPPHIEDHLEVNGSLLSLSDINQALDYAEISGLQVQQPATRDKIIIERPTTPEQDLAIERTVDILPCCYAEAKSHVLG